MADVDDGDSNGAKVGLEITGQPCCPESAVRQKWKSRSCLDKAPRSA